MALNSSKLSHGSRPLRIALISDLHSESKPRLETRLPDILAIEKPDIILLDLLLPKLNGFDFLKDIKANPELASIPVVVLSNLGDKADIDRAKGLGALDYFIKADTDLKVLAEKIEKVLA